MYNIYDRWPEISRAAYQENHESPDFGNIDHIIFSGMGGSGSVGDLLAAIFSKTNIHVTVVKGYLLPKTVDQNTLVITTSVSGNTMETLSVLESAKKHTKKIMAFSDGGKMKKFCDSNNLQHKNIPMIHSPRASLPRILFSLLNFLKNILPINYTEIEDSIKQMELLKNKINSTNLTSQNPSLDLAEWITGIPLIYYPWGLQSAATRFKNSIHENAKTHAITEDIIEASHNEVMGWETKSNVQPILIQGVDDYIKTKERWKILKEFFENKNIRYHEVFSIEGNILSKLMNLIYLFDYSTIYLAAKNGIDPSPIKSIDFIKSRIIST